MSRTSLTRIMAVINTVFIRSLFICRYCGVLLAAACVFGVLMLAGEKVKKPGVACSCGLFTFPASITTGGNCDLRLLASSFSFLVFLGIPYCGRGHERSIGSNWLSTFVSLDMYASWLPECLCALTTMKSESYYNEYEWCSIVHYLSWELSWVWSYGWG